MFAAVLDYIARTNLFNFIIFAGIIIYILVKLDISNSMDKSIAQVEQNINDSQTAKTEAEEKLQDMQSKVANLETEINEILKQSEDNANLVGEQIISAANKTADNIHLNSDKLVENKVAVLRNDIMKRASLASVEIARNHIIQELNNNSELHGKLIDESIEAINEVGL